MNDLIVTGNGFHVRGAPGIIAQALDWSIKTDMSNHKKIGWAWLSLLIVSLTTAILLKLFLVAGDLVPFNADEAVVALMARHILQGEFPVFFYGQAYMGSLDAILVALGFRIFGEAIWVIRLVQIILYIGTILTTAILGHKIFNSWQVGILASWILAVPAINVTLYTTASLGGYGEALLLGNLTILLTLWLTKSPEMSNRSRAIGFALLGGLMGLGFWAFGLTLVYSVPAILYLLWRMWRGGVFSTRSQGFLQLGLLTVGFLLGSFMLFQYALENGFSSLVHELRGGAIAGVSGLSFFEEVVAHLFSLLVLGSTAIFGFRPPWSVVWLGLPLLPFVLMFWMGVIFFLVRQLPKRVASHYGIEMLVGVLIAVVAGFIFTPFGNDPSGRYFLPLAPPLALFAAGWIMELRQKWGEWAYGLMVLIIVYHLWGTVQVARMMPPGITTQFDQVAQVDHRDMPALIDFLLEQDERFGYTNYWVAYPMAFRSTEQLVYIPALPYHLDFRYTPRDNRYAPYANQVARAERVAYITTNHPPLNDALRSAFTELGVTWQEEIIGDYYVFYKLSKPIHPEKISEFIRP